MTDKQLDRRVRPLKIRQPTKCKKCSSITLWHIKEFLCPVCGWTDYQEAAVVVTSIKDFNEILKSKNAHHVGRNYVVLDNYENILKVKKVYTTTNRNKKIRQGGDWHRKYLYDVPTMMVLCPRCHKDIHVEEKYQWSYIDWEYGEADVMPFKYKSTCVVSGCEIKISLIHEKAKAYLWWEIK